MLSSLTTIAGTQVFQWTEREFPYAFFSFSKSGRDLTEFYSDPEALRADIIFNAEKALEHYGER